MFIFRCVNSVISDTCLPIKYSTKAAAVFPIVTINIVQSGPQSPEMTIVKGSEGTGVAPKQA